MPVDICYMIVLKSKRIDEVASNGGLDSIWCDLWKDSIISRTVAVLHLKGDLTGRDCDWNLVGKSVVRLNHVLVVFMACFPEVSRGDSISDDWFFVANHHRSRWWLNRVFSIRKCSDISSMFYSWEPGQRAITLYHTLPVLYHGAKFLLTFLGLFWIFIGSESEGIWPKRTRHLDYFG